MGNIKIRGKALVGIGRPCAASTFAEWAAFRHAVIDAVAEGGLDVRLIEGVEFGEIYAEVYVFVPHECSNDQIYEHLMGIARNAWKRCGEDLDAYSSGRIGPVVMRMIPVDATSAWNLADPWQRNRYGQQGAMTNGTSAGAVEG